MRSGVVVGRARELVRRAIDRIALPLHPLDAALALLTALFPAEIAPDASVAGVCPESLKRGRTGQE